MNFHNQTALKTCEYLSTDIKNGLSELNHAKNLKKYGKNKLTAKGKENIFKKIFNAVKEPMLIILLISFLITFGINLVRQIRFGSADFGECLGILGAIVLSVTITLIMEGSSEKAFNALNKIYDNLVIKVIRQGRVIMVSQESVVVGDIVVLESGDKIVADGRLVEGLSLKVDEATLTGESLPTSKIHDAIYDEKTPLAERKNMVYSGTYVTEGSGKMVVTAVGDGSEIGKIAGELKKNKEESSPLQEKLAKLSKTVTIIGITSSVFVFIISFIKMLIMGTVTFSGVQSLFVSCIVLIVAAVPEGLPTIVAVSLALNMIKLAKRNALIKKMVATETTGAVSVICSDKTGTLTKNKMSVFTVCENHFCYNNQKKLSEALIDNFILNTTADVVKRGNDYHYKGSGTEGALIVYAIKHSKKSDYRKIREKYNVIDRVPFSSKIKYMSTTIEKDGKIIDYLKGAPEIVLDFCNLKKEQKDKILLEIKVHQQKARRVLCFAHKEESDIYIYDGFVVLTDEIREDVFDAVNQCKRAGIDIKILTGDNFLTAYSVGEQLGIVNNLYQVINAREIEEMDDESLKKILPKVSIIARSTPLVKLRVVKVLKSLNEVVAVTGDGINDAPAIKHADVGIAMGKTGTEITKEASDIVLLDDSFSTIVKAICFGRNVYKNLQRFIVFQLSINISALFLIVVCALLGLNTPFNTLQLLWINIIMDGPPALTLGMEAMNDKLMDNPPVKRSDGIVTKSMFLRILACGLFVGAVCFMQYSFNFLCVDKSEKASAIFTLFIVFQLLNAFNCRELGLDSIFKSVTKNKIMVATFSFTFLFQIIIVTFFYKGFGLNPMSLNSWLKICCLALSIIVLSELTKWILRIFKGKKLYFVNKKPIK